ncbi:glycosyltransferase family 2 protein [Croceicoccus marinus]|uniref:Glycosyltransferase family 2 protein n=1 Tax=Croceicoccus marinus TaxID=450378 RepID=A0A1Z1FE88_9SPHN|nr:glycosyltransferase family 2 protein [Croceicoccus marinus]ARU17094.1 hypothetical protein A9D14_14140 [Croceicoccus marinus]
MDETFMNAVDAASRDHRIIAICVCRNEYTRMQSWLAHYRAIGVGCFAVIDNGSDDGTYEFLDAQPDVILTRTTASYAESKFGIRWVDAVRARISNRIWLLHTDADEQIIYRGWPERPLTDLVREAESDGANTIFSFMLDMYPEGPMEEGQPLTGHDLAEAAPLFDSDYHFRLRPVKPWRGPDGWVEVVGGPRVRLMSSVRREARSNWRTYWLRGQSDRVLPRMPRRFLPLALRALPTQMPVLAKYPLVQTQTKVSYHHCHAVGNADVFRESTVLLHFKFLADFADRVRREVERGEHYNGGAEYVRYADMIRRHKGMDLRYPGSARFQGSDQLIEMGLIRDVSDFGAYPF